MIIIQTKRRVDALTDDILVLDVLDKGVAGCRCDDLVTS
jgi:hypothetical protein